MVSGFKCRHAKSREPGNLVPGHFLSKFRTFFRNQRFIEINLKLWSGFVKNRFKWMPVLLHFYMKHHKIYSNNLNIPIWETIYYDMSCPYQSTGNANPLISFYIANLSKWIVRTFPDSNPGSRTKIVFLHVWPPTIRNPAYRHTDTNTLTCVHTHTHNHR